MTHFEFMESQGQLTIFECMIVDQQLQIGDKVECIVTAEQDLEAYYFLKYYHPQALTSIGEIVQIERKAATVRFRGDYMMVSVEYLVRV